MTRRRRGARGAGERHFGEHDDEMERDGGDDEAEEQVEVQVVAFADDVGDVRTEVVEAAHALAERRVVLGARRLLDEARRAEGRLGEPLGPREAHDGTHLLAARRVDDARILEDGQREVEHQARHESDVARGDGGRHGGVEVVRAIRRDDQSDRARGEAAHAPARRLRRRERRQQHGDDGQARGADEPSVVADRRGEGDAAHGRGEHAVTRGDARHRRHSSFGFLRRVGATVFFSVNTNGGSICGGGVVGEQGLLLLLGVLAAAALGLEDAAVRREVVRVARLVLVVAGIAIGRRPVARAQRTAIC
mmetsp:Transcript_7680/g.31768  ORF Transcript_7680/g.31768 Transcript_7680/m.31768 type:complete len:306 (+) Transcript_7680:809-1726(+)